MLYPLIKCRAIVCSKAVRAFFWLVFAIGCSVVIVLALDSLHVTDNQLPSSSRFEILPKPNKRSTIHFNYKYIDSVNSWTKKIDKSLNPYRREHPHNVDCDFHKLPTANETCKVDIEAMTPCIRSNDYGYSKGSPCIFIKLKKFRDFVPEFLDYHGLLNSGLSSNVVGEIKERIAKDNPLKLKTIWISCDGKSTNDRANVGLVEYIPWKGFPGYFFPYKGQDTYQEPITAIKFVNPATNVLIDIDCKIIARNLNETVSFRLLVDDSVM